MARLPEQDEQDWVLRELARLIERRGAEPFLNAPLLEPSDEFFPDQWTPDQQGVRTLIRRILSYAGISDLQPVITYFEGVTSERTKTRGIEGTFEHQGTAAWFAGIEGHECYFGVDPAQLGMPDQLVGTLCHEVAHVYRAVHHLRAGSRDEEERLTDLTALYLGFGVLVTNNAFRYRTAGEMRGSAVVHQWSHEATGYLSLEVFSFALAVQAVARGMSKSQLRHVSRLLETAQSATFEKSRKLLSADPQRLRGELGLGNRLPAAGDMRPVASPLAEERAVAEAPVAPRDDEPLDEEPPTRHVVWRVERERSLPSVVAAFMMGAMGGVMATAPLAGIVRDVVPAPVLIAFCSLGALTVGILLARKAWPKPPDICSSPGCECPLSASMKTCPRCRGRIAGSLKNPLERLAREEELGLNAGIEED